MGWLLGTCLGHFKIVIFRLTLGTIVGYNNALRLTNEVNLVSCRGVAQSG